MKAGLTDKKYIKAVKKSHLGSKQIIDKVFTINKLDAICGLTMGPACSIDMIYGDVGRCFLTTPAAAVVIHITVPCGKVYDFTCWVFIFGPAYSEPKLMV
jgi:amidase